MNKWTESKAKNGKARSFDSIGIRALNTAFAEGMPFTALNVCNVKGRHFTHNYK